MILPTLPVFGVLDLSTTPLADYEYLINKYAADDLLDPMDIATLILVESDGNPRALNQKSKATGLCGIMSKESGSVFKNRPTIEELYDPETNISWCVKIFSRHFHRTHSTYGALYQYSGGSYWTNLDKFEKVYWARFLDKKGRLISAGAKYKIYNNTDGPVEGNPQDNELPIPGNRH
jgi:soluble lytic murein transglycosylase-like protein